MRSVDTVAVDRAGGLHRGDAVPAADSADGHRVIGVDLAGDVDRRADVADPSSTIAALAGADAVVHTAAIVGEVGRMADHVRVNVGGTRTCSTRRPGAASSSSRRSRSGATTSRATCARTARRGPCGLPYIDTKGAAEVLALRRGATVVRPGDVYGPRSGSWVVRPLELMRPAASSCPRRATA